MTEQFSKQVSPLAYDDDESYPHPPNARATPKADLNPVFSTFRKKDLVATLEWKDIDYHVGKKHVIKSISGEAHPGQVVAIMGPSGSGKSTLLNILACRIQSGGKKKLTGTLSMNGHVVKPLSFRKQVAYVTQEDALFATATVRESLEFSCRLRLPASTTYAERERIVYDIIISLGLRKCEHTIIGSELIRGVSGGEKKRVAIGVELVSNPSILYLDEPTSGLDSHSAMNVVRLLKAIANMSTTVICSIHQPSSQVFALFDILILLGSGTAIYQGPVTEIDAPFNKMDIYFPERTNVADHVLLLVQTLPLDKLPNNSKNLNRTAQAIVVEPAAESEQPEVDVKKNLAKPGMLVQAKWLMVREFRSVYRDRAGLLNKIGVNVFMYGFIALLFMGAADQSKSNYSLQTHFGALALLVFIALLLVAQAALMTFPLERIIFVREKATNTYGVVPYLFAKLLIELPMSYAITLLGQVIVYWAIGFRANFFYFSLCLWAVGLAAVSASWAVGAMVSSAKSAQELGPLVLIPQFLFMGLFIRLDQMPDWLAWIQYLCSAKYALNLAMLLEYDPSLADSEMNKMVWAAFLDLNDVHEDETWLYAVLLVAIFALFRVVAMIALNHKAKQLG